MGDKTMDEKNLRGVLVEIAELLDGLGPEITLESVQDDYIARARYLAEVYSGKREPFPEV